jgi:hypothetical protein
VSAEGSASVTRRALQAWRLARDGSGETLRFPGSRHQGCVGAPWRARQVLISGSSFHRHFMSECSEQVAFRKQASSSRQTHEDATTWSLQNSPLHPVTMHWGTGAGGGGGGAGIAPRVPQV